MVLAARAAGISGVFSPSPGALQDLDHPDIWSGLKQRSGRVPGLTMNGSQFSKNQAGMALVADARLEHRGDLAATLKRSSTDADADLLLAAWHAFGADSLNLVEGEFAFAVWDPAKRTLALARDSLGRRPVHYAEHKGVFAFATLPLPLARMRGHVRADLDRLAAFVALLPESGPASFLDGVSRVMPGHVAVVGHDGGWRQTRWWRPRLTPVGISFDSAVLAVQTAVDRAVAAAVHDMPAPVAAQLTGGLDSAIVCSSAARLAKPDEPLVTVTGSAGGSVDGRQSGFFEDEVDRARATAAVLGRVKAHIVSTAPLSPLVAAERNWLVAQRPYLNPCNGGWLDATYEQARDAGASVVLEGTMGNFTVSWDGFERLGELVRSFAWIELAHEFFALRRAGAGSLRGVVQWAITEAFPGAARQEPFGPRFLRPASPMVARLRSSVRRSRRWRSSAARRLAEIEFVDPGLIQHAVRARFGLDQRDPLAARRLVELCLQLPAGHFYRDGRTRRIARALLRGVVPDMIVDEPRRGYQGADWREGAEAAIQAMLAVVAGAAHHEQLADLFDLPRLRQALLDWPTDGWEVPQQVQTYRRDVVRAVCALEWVNHVDRLGLDEELVAPRGALTPD